MKITNTVRGTSTVFMPYSHDIVLGLGEEIMTDDIFLMSLRPLWLLIQWVGMSL